MKIEGKILPAKSKIYNLPKVKWQLNEKKPFTFLV